MFIKKKKLFEFFIMNQNNLIINFYKEKKRTNKIT